MRNAAGGPLDIGKVLSTSYAIALSRLSVYFVLGLLVSTPTILIELLRPDVPVPLGDVAQDVSVAADAPTLSPFVEVPLVLLGLILGSFATAAATYMMIADLRGTRFDVTEALANGLRALPQVLGVLIVLLVIFFGIAVGALTVWTAIALGIAGDAKSPLGLLALPLLVVPTVIVWLMMSVVVPVIVVERAGVLDSIRRSAEMTKDYLWPLFYLFAVFALIFVGVGVGFGGLVWALFGQEFLGNPLYIIASQVVGTFLGIFSWSIIAVVYYQLRSARESGPASAAGA
jgi:hypothetical protein